MVEKYDKNHKSMSRWYETRFDYVETRAKQMANVIAGRHSISLFLYVMFNVFVSSQRGTYLKQKTMPNVG